MNFKSRARSDRCSNDKCKSPFVVGAVLSSRNNQFINKEHLANYPEYFRAIVVRNCSASTCLTRPCAAILDQHHVIVNLFRSEDHPTVRLADPYLYRHIAKTDKIK